jgi:ribosomal protein L21E
MFQGVRQNTPFYILEKGDEVKLKIGHVVSVSNPQPKYNNQFGVGPAYSNQQEMFVDIKVRVGEETMEFKQLSANMTIANTSNLVVSDSKEAMSVEVEGLLRNSKQIIESVPYHEKVIKACDEMLCELNPQFAKEKEQEEKIGMLEDKIVNIDDKLNRMFDMLSDTLKRKPKE